MNTFYACQSALPNSAEMRDCLLSEVTHRGRRELSANADMGFAGSYIRSPVELEFRVDRGPKIARVAPPAEALGKPLGTERDGNAEDNDPDLTGKGTPAVQRPGQVDMHVTGPPSGNGKPNSWPCVSNEWNADIPEFPQGLSATCLKH